MKYFVLLAEAPEAWERATEAERQAVMDAHRDFAVAVDARATMLAGEALAGPETAVTLRPGDTGADKMVTDGPYAETVEQLGGFYLVEADDRETVVDLCRILPPGYTIEIWPVVQIEGFED
jgi:hypothetical protein